MNKFKKIYITSDFLMTKEIEQLSNRRWLKDILERPIHAATGMYIESFFSSLNQEDCFSRIDFFNMSGIDLDIEVTQFYFDVTQITNESIEYLNEFLSESLIIGYELSEQTKTIMNKLGLVYIDIWLHPIRFLDDILFAFQSNSYSIQEALYTYNVPEYIYGLYADRLKIQSYKGWRRDEIKLPANSGLFVGQMLNDKSVNNNGQFLSLLDFKREFEEFVSLHQHVLYSRHPYLRKGDEAILEYLSTFSNVSLTEIPTYQLLGSLNLKTVMSISSSVLEEAKYFRKRTVMLYKPVIKLANDFSMESFASIYQSFVNPKFWEKILSSVMTVKSCPDISYFNEKDKLRDMLGFYWSYKDIDKLEELRTLPRKGVSNKKSLPIKTKPLPEKTVHYNSFPSTLGFEDFKRIKKSIRKATVISFDIFDTLLERRIHKPEALFYIMEDYIYHHIDKSITSFAEVRKNSRNISKHLTSGEEIPLRDRYLAIAKELNISESLSLELMELELELEKRILITKPFGFKAYQYAKKLNKRVILVSDTFYTDEFITEVLKTSGYVGWDKLYTSSSYNLLKDTSNLYDIVLKKEGVKAESILHIGDNKHSDIKQAKSKGLSTFYAPATRVLFCKHNPLCKLLESMEDKTYRYIYNSLLFEKNRSFIEQGEFSYCNYKVGNFGYSILGSIFLGFSKWILESAINDNIEHIYFFSRDGEIVKKCYDLIADFYPEAPKSHYIYASRRSIRVASLGTIEDIKKVLSTNFTPMPLKDLLHHRFGIKASEIPQKLYIKHGFESAESTADWSRNQQELLNFFCDPFVSEIIINNARIEAEALKAYYLNNEITSDKSIAFVDIGHSGTLQAGIIKLLGLTSTVGYYFATFNNITLNIQEPHVAYGYLVDKINPKTNNTYMKNILMYEMVFLNDQDSFTKIKFKDKKLIPEFLHIEDNDSFRKNFSREVHMGIVDYIKDVLSYYQELNLSLYSLKLSASDATIAYEKFLTDARISDISLFKGLAFENVYSGRDMQWIIPPSNKQGINIIWKSGYRKLYHEDFIFPNPSLMKKIIHKCMGKLVLLSHERLVKKYNDSPELYYKDSKYKLVVRIGKYLFK